MAGRIYVPCRSLDDWRVLLKDPGAQWKEGRSAVKLATHWLDAPPMPEPVQSALDTCLGKLEMLMGFPEFGVGIAGGRAESQNDLFVLGRTDRDLVSIMVEGKVDEPLADVVSAWLAKSDTRRPRLDWLCRYLGLQQSSVTGVRYQLLHRTASSLILAERFHATKAVMLVHSFSPHNASFGDFERFCRLFGINPVPGTVHSARRLHGIDLYLGWVSQT